jgi:hypothetical protein
MMNLKTPADVLFILLGAIMILQAQWWCMALVDG